MIRLALALGCAAAAAVACPSARAQASLHDIPWYEAHDGARAATLRICRNDAAYARMPDCENAELAQNRADNRARLGAASPGSPRTRSGRVQTLDEMLSDPAHYDNAVTRAVALGNCAHPENLAPGMRPRPEECAAARAAEAQAAARKGNHGR
jgi:hypothetical protein